MSGSHFRVTTVVCFQERKKKRIVMDSKRVSYFSEIVLGDIKRDQGGGGGMLRRSCERKGKEGWREEGLR